ncbi:hypothetical protein MCG98_16440 [Ruminococcus sp. OA3]|uniref:hypothetical protein n=1 Tax=Ruminococcus sp. OA3 TaxID=2914164 RepID=UPI001F06606A|nr:hypothetical protein [Ruminococcus sp. OA3]MCH1982495.1 hypothetical protein [Ruminococcus sp. OA3]MCH1984156.1 hypothetical protein [Ruminococcus sp. OA3]
MTEQEIEDFVRYLDKDTRGYCVAPDQQNPDCCDCYLCRFTFFNQVREELKSL